MLSSYGSASTRPTCPACAGSAIRLGPRSRATGRAIARCGSCGASYWATADAASTEVVSEADMSGEDLADWVDIKRPESGPEAWRATTARLRSACPGTEAPLLYDVGAGDGSYLAVARDEFGFRVGGNEIVAAAIDVARERHEVTLDLGDLGALGHDGDIDAITMWCVLAHVPDADQLLHDVRAALRPGGVLFLQTPRRTVADRAAQWVQRASGGRLSRIADRRIAEHHSILHTERSITAQLGRAGFTDVRTEPVARYSLQSRAYLASMNPPDWTLGPASWLMDRAVASPAAPRIVLDAYARRPLTG
ncbi:class I SAM-dependent methyltransferase [Nocardioides panacisoli]|uniref:class I SAM-dependent methyltransferase n=1 Tax=Nocardioides panacisoli TaxID=627624 RepID=UPI001C631CDF|nr:class I SAM-dependent methyltransferase [Nocardioides panacisoli]QYJ03925.1 class I SAM-dependent methyltransferase [Nocardioides panacisoli]